MASMSSQEPYSLLITDDDRPFRETLQEIFEPEGFRTILAESGEEALEIMQARAVHLSLLDYHMPRLTGLETLRIIRRRQVLLPVILITAERTTTLVREARSAKAYCVIAKPVTREIVISTVRRALSC